MRRERERVSEQVGTGCPFFGGACPNRVRLLNAACVSSETKGCDGDMSHQKSSRHMICEKKTRVIKSIALPSPCSEPHSHARVVVQPWSGKQQGNRTSNSVVVSAGVTTLCETMASWTRSVAHAPVGSAAFGRRREPNRFERSVRGPDEVSSTVAMRRVAVRSVRVRYDP